MLAVFFIFCFVFSLLAGRYQVRPGIFLKLILSRLYPIKHSWPAIVENVIFEVRMPRVIMASLIGAGLSAAGAAYQGIFRNPMVSPDVLGASQGSCFGAALGILLALSYKETALSAFCFGLASVLLVSAVSSRVKYNPMLGLVLAGIMIGTLFQSAIAFIKLVADPNNTLPAITYWLMGSFASTRMQDVCFAGPSIAAGIILLYLLRWKINVLTLGDEEAASVGLHVKLVRALVITGSTLITAAAVSVSGLIGWVGLVIPHLARMLVGNDYRHLMPASLLLGAGFMLAVDDIARLAATSEIPIGILTSFAGAPFFLYLIIRQGRNI